MAFSANDVLDVAQLYLRHSLTDSEGLRIFNQGLNQLGSLGLIHSVETYEATSEAKTVDLGADCIGVIYVVDENDNLYYRWKYVDGEVTFAEAGEYKIHYRILHPPVETLDEEALLHNLYKACLTSYVIGFAKLKDDDYSHDGIRNMQDFERLGVQAFNTVIKSRKPTQVRTFRHG